MTDTFRVFNIQKSVAISAFLHGSIFLLLALTLTHTEVVPIGVEVQYFAGPKGVAAVAPPKPRVRSLKIEKAEASILPSSAVASQAESTANNASTGPVGQADGAIVTALERYKYELRLFLESRKIYPESAKRLHQTGTVIIEFKVNPEGQLLDVNLSSPSKSEALNRAALDLVKRASTFKPFPKEVQMQELKLLLPIEYVL